MGLDEVLVAASVLAALAPESEPPDDAPDVPSDEPDLLSEEPDPLEDSLYSFVSRARLRVP